jgi:hypothetical protein
MKTSAALLLAITLVPSATMSAGDANAGAKSSASSTALRGASSSSSSSATRHLQVPADIFCYGYIDEIDDGPTHLSEIDCTQQLLSRCHPFDPSQCFEGNDGDEFVYNIGVPCNTFAVWPTGETPCEWAYTCC